VECVTSNVDVCGSGVKVGSNNYTATDGVDNWTGTVKVKKNTCTSVEIQ